MIIDLNKDLNKLYELHVGDVVELKGTIYTARDAAHMRLEGMLKNNEALNLLCRSNSC